MSWIANYRPQGVEIRFSGRCDANEVLDAHERVFNRRYAEGLQYVIVDFSSVEYLDMPLADLLIISEQHRQFLLRNPPFLLALVAPQAPVLALMRTFQRYMEGTSLRLKVTHTRDAALAWLRGETLESV